MAMTIQKPVSISIKGKTIHNVVEDIKKDAMDWGGSVEAEKTYEVSGKIREITLIIKFKVH